VARHAHRRALRAKIALFVAIPAAAAVNLPLKTVRLARSAGHRH
jgi:hypothetical protein